jgi:DDE superfamily endonuclease
LSSNGWTNNEIGLEWIKQCFEPETQCGNDEYRLLILDGYASYITTKAIKFCLASKIILLCLPPHTTHLLQPLDVGIFAPLATAYKAGVQERSKYIVSYSVDKIEFLEILKEARDKAITPLNIQKLWKAVGLEPYNPEVVLRQLPEQPTAQLVTPLSTITWTGPSGEVVQVPITPANIAQVNELFKQIVEGEHKLDSAVILQIQKLRKGASKALANVSIQRTTNVGLIEAELTKKKRSNREKGKNYTFGRVLNKETIKERQAFAKFKEHWAWISKCQPNLLILKKKTQAIGQAKGQSKKQVIEQANGGRTTPAGPRTTTTAGQKATTTAGPRTTTAGLNERIVRAAVTEGTGQAQKQDEQAIQTRSGRISVKRVIFEAGRN